MKQLTPESLHRRIQAAQGQIPCDLVIRGVRYLDVFSCEWREGDLSIIDGVIVGVDRGLKARRFFDGQGKFVVPGFIDAHVHVESSLLMPLNFQKAVLPRGTTTAICDPHELANVEGVAGIRFFLDSAEKMDLDLRIMLSSCVPATHLETNGGGVIPAEALAPLSAHSKALGLAEMMNMPGVLSGDPEVLRKLSVFSGLPIDGHAPLLRGQKLSAYASTGIASCHESSEFEEAREKLIKGMSVWIREGSVAKDLDALAPLLTLATSTSVGFCTDDRNPLDILSEGHIDHLVRQSIRKGIAPEVAYRSASWTVARHYGLDRGVERVGAIAPGYRADLVLLEDAQACGIHSVVKSGVWIQELAPVRDLPRQDQTNTMRARPPESKDLEGPSGRVHVIGVLPGKIITERQVAGSGDSGVAHLSVLERYGHGSKPANGYVRGFGASFKGAIASSVGHDSHNLIAVGDQPEDMRVAMKALIESGGGFCVVSRGQVAAKLDLPFGGLMSDRDPIALKQSLVALKTASRDVGCELSEPFLQLAFLSLPVIPSLKLTDRGLVDVDAFQIIDVRAS
jgi:adenine deaminase